MSFEDSNICSSLLRGGSFGGFSSSGFMLVKDWSIMLFLEYLFSDSMSIARSDGPTQRLKNGAYRYSRVLGMLFCPVLALAQASLRALERPYTSLIHYLFLGICFSFEEWRVSQHSLSVFWALGCLLGQPGYKVTWSWWLHGTLGRSFLQCQGKDAWWGLLWLLSFQGHIQVTQLRSPLSSENMFQVPG